LVICARQGASPNHVCRRSGLTRRDSYPVQSDALTGSKK
jgi:hypothetical protein